MSDEKIEEIHALYIELNVGTSLPPDAHRKILSVSQQFVESVISVVCEQYPGTQVLSGKIYEVPLELKFTGDDSVH